MNLHQYLVNIEANKAINLTKFIAVLPAQHKLNWKSIFTHTPASGRNQYHLAVIDQISFKQLFDTSKPSHNRVDAATKGNSHTHKTSMSYLLVYPDVFNCLVQSDVINPQPPKVVVCDKKKCSMSFKPQKRLIIIENQETFFRYQAFILRLRNDITDNNKSVDIAFGSGNSVTNSFNSMYFNQYDEVLCCFDYDLGGLTMFASLQKMISTKLTFVLPDKALLTDEAFITSHFKKSPKHEQDWRQAITLAKHLGFENLAQAFAHSKKFMEQEVYLSDSF
ncbi:hypothetical protein [Colwellia echini]|uniref:Wadjet protein JetD C-terminal domain-containing protein n=1 Tax=Colwellia echini TaxID=1982103 RepID=A0ABY3N0E0_9GAMM|nr:hypothetical protein [Colwellia echini]TYK66910.1 hypothetical protein CWS31_003780 [Colwellia echini]